MHVCVGRSVDKEPQSVFEINQIFFFGAAFRSVGLRIVASRIDIGSTSA
jgi:hypothetical protein